MPFIEVRNLTKSFVVRKKREKGAWRREKNVAEALKGVSFSIEKGELVGYIGPNGAGKSTTVKLLSGILTPDGGDIAVGGLVPYRQRERHVRDIGVVFGQRTQLWWDVPIRDSYSLLRDIYRVDKDRHEKRLGELCERLELGSLLSTPLRQMSLGQRMRAELAGSLLHEPKLLFLDEPTIGLDAVSKLALRDFLREENRLKGTTVLLTTHDMEDISALCERVMVLGHGRLLFDGTFHDLLARYDKTRVVHVRYFGEASLPPLPGCLVEREGGDYVISYQPSLTPTDSLLTALQKAGSIAELTAQGQSVDHLIARMYKEMAL